MRNDYDIVVSATIDYIHWTCPECKQENESGSELDTCCNNCGYDIQNDAHIPTDLEEVITGCYYKED